LRSSVFIGLPCPKKIAGMRELVAAFMGACAQYGRCAPTAAENAGKGA